MLYETAQTLAPPKFDWAALRLLGRFVGFDGAVWGSGAGDPATGRFVVAHANLLDRPPALLSDYATVVARDPVTAAFVRAPHRLQTIDVLSDYRHPHVLPVRDYLQAHRIGHLVLLGAPILSSTSSPAVQGAVSWITAYRSPKDRPFSARETAVFQALLPHWQSARRVSVAVHGEARLVRVCSASPLHPRDQLSARERQVLDLVARGFSYGQAAERLGLSIATVYTHARNLYAKLEVHNKTEAVFEARQLGLL